jgi:DNA-binding GntR family transcriptional regulator
MASIEGASVEPKIERRTLSSQIYAILEDRILSGELAPGTPLSEETLAVTYGVSRAPAREAIVELERVGLAVRSGPRDRAVAVPTEEMITQKYDVWWIVDVGRTYLASLQATLADHATLRTLIDGMNEGVKRKDLEHYRKYCDSFHLKIRHDCQNALLNTMDVSCDLHIRWFEALYDQNPEVSADAVREHYNILDAFERRDFGALGETIRAHILRQRSRIVDLFKTGEAVEGAEPRRTRPRRKISILIG